METINIFSAVFEEVLRSPAFAYVVVFVNVVVFVWEAVPFFPSKIVPIVSILLGTVLYPLLVSPGMVNPAFPYPLLVLITDGLLAGLLSYALHSGFVLALRKFTGWPPVSSTVSPTPTKEVSTPPQP